VSPVTRHAYWAALDALAKCRELDAAEGWKALGYGSAAAWWKVAEPRWRSLNAVLDQAEREDWVRAAVWLSLWRDARGAGVAPGSIDVQRPEHRSREEERARCEALTTPTTAKG
jgi:hypothetical protein